MQVVQMLPVKRFPFTGTELGTNIKGSLHKGTDVIVVAYGVMNDSLGVFVGLVTMLVWVPGYDRFSSLWNRK